MFIRLYVLITFFNYILIHNIFNWCWITPYEVKGDLYKHWSALMNWWFWIVIWRRLLKVPWTAKRSNQSILKEINPEYSLEGLMLKLKLQYFGHLMQRPWFWERLKAGEEGDNRGWDGWMASPIPWTWVWTSSGRWWRTGKPGMLQSMGLQRARHDWVNNNKNRCHSWEGGTSTFLLQKLPCRKQK